MRWRARLLAGLLGSMAAHPVTHAFLAPRVDVGSIIAVAKKKPSDTDKARGIPDTARYGEMSPPRGRQVEIDGDRATLAPGAKIFDLKNRIVLPASIIEEVDVWYILDQYRQIKRVWIAGDE